MNILLKYLLNSILEKKSRMLLIIFSITIGTALLVASLGISDSITNSYVNTLKGAYENFNVEISANSKAKDPLFNVSDFKAQNIKETFKTAAVNGYVKNDDSKTFNMLGTSLEDFKKFKSIKILKSLNLDAFNGNKLIISDKTSTSLKLKLGDKVNLYTLGKTKEYTVSAIASNSGLFLSDTSSNFTLITPIKNVCDIYGEDNKYSSMFIAVNESSINNWIKNFNNQNSNFTAKLLVDESAVSSQASTIKISMLFMLGIVLIMSIFIIYSSFKMIITERLSVFGTFLSTGATKLNIVFLLLKESFVYGFIGSILGNFLGAIIIYLSSNLTNPLKEEGIKAAVNFNYMYFLYGFILALMVSIISALAPILSIKKLPVKEVILNNFEVSNKTTIKGFIIGILLIALAIVLHLLGGNIKGQRPYITALPAFFIGFAAIVIIIPKLVDILLYPFVRFFRKTNSTLMLSTNNVRTSKILQNNIRLISVSVIAIVIIMSFSLSLNDMLTGVYKKLNFNISVSINSNNANILKASNDIIENSAKNSNIIKHQYITTNLNGDFSKEINVLCIDPKNFKSYDDYLDYTNKASQLEELSHNEDGIIISKKISTRYKIKKGDNIKLYLDNKEENFKVLSIVDAKFMNMGNVNLISFSAAEKHFNIKYCDDFFISTTSSEAKLKADLTKKLKGLPISIGTKADSIEHDKQSCKQIVELLSIFSYITMIIGSIGVLSNISLSFIKRKRELAVLSSVGLTKGSRNTMLLCESFIGAIIGLLVSFASAALIILLLRDIFKYLVLDMNFSYPFNNIPFISIFMLVLGFIATLPTLIKSEKLEIVSQLKYE